MAVFCYIRTSGIKKLVKENNRRCGAGFLDAFDRFVYEKIISCCRQFNGHKKTLDRAVAELILKQKEVLK